MNKIHEPVPVLDPPPNVFFFNWVFSYAGREKDGMEYIGIGVVIRYLTLHIYSLIKLLIYLSFAEAFN